MRFPVKPPGTKMYKTKNCYMFSWVVSPFEPVQARVNRPSSRESLLNWILRCVVFDFIFVSDDLIILVIDVLCSDVFINKYLCCYKL